MATLPIRQQSVREHHSSGVTCALAFWLGTNETERSRGLREVLFF